MKLLRVGKLYNEVPAALDKKGKIRDLSSIIKDLDSDTINFETLEKIEKINLETFIQNNNSGIYIVKITGKEQQRRTEKFILK